LPLTGASAGQVVPCGLTPASEAVVETPGDVLLAGDAAVEGGVLSDGDAAVEGGVLSDGDAADWSAF